MKNKLRRVIMIGIVSSILIGTASPQATAINIDVSKSGDVYEYIKNSSQELTDKSFGKLTKIYEALKEYVEKYVTEYVELEPQYGVEANVKWNVKFSSNVNNESLSLDSKGHATSKSPIKVINEKGKEVGIKLNIEGRNVEVEKASGNYESGKTYALIVTKDIKGEGKDMANLMKLRQEVVMYFTIDEKGTIKPPIDSGSFEIEVPEYMDDIMDIYMGRAEFSDLFSDANDMYFKAYYTNEEIYDLAWEWENEYYKNPKYEAVTDPHYYMNYPDITINFDNVNNHLISDLSIQSYFNMFNGYRPSDFYEYTKQRGERDILHSWFVWRPDFEKEMIELINEERVKRGLNPLEIDPNLMAISKWGAVRNHFAYTTRLAVASLVPEGDYAQTHITDDQTVEELFGDSLVKADKPSVISWNHSWSFGNTPLGSSYANPWALVSKDEQRLAYTYYEETDINEMIDQWFDYDKEVRMINYNSLYLYEPSEFLDYWNEQEVVSLTERVFEASSSKNFANQYYRGSFDIEKILYDPELKYIGVGTMYVHPMIYGDYNGMTGIYLLTSK